MLLQKREGDRFCKPKTGTLEANIGKDSTRNY